MKLAFILYKYFPHGGLQRDFLRIARCCHDRGHEIKVHTMSWIGDVPDWIELVLYDTRSKLLAHKKNELFAKKVTCRLRAEKVDLKIGFNKLPGLDVYYAADSCYAEKVGQSRGNLYKYTPRYKHFSAFESAVFSKNIDTDILLIAHNQREVFQKYYQTSDDKFHLLPPGIARDRCYPDNGETLRAKFRKQHELKADDFLLLMVGSGFKTKGVDRSINALAALPDSIRQRMQLFIVGQDKPGAFIKIAKKLNVEHQVHFFSGRDDVLHFYLGADLLVHPAYNENTGTVLLEAAVAGLPVMCTDICGYAQYIKQANFGVVLDSPFSIATMRDAIVAVIASNKREQWKVNALNFASEQDIFSMPEKAALSIDLIAKQRINRSCSE